MDVACDVIMVADIVVTLVTVVPKVRPSVLYVVRIRLLDACSVFTNFDRIRGCCPCFRIRTKVKLLRLQASFKSRRCISNINFCGTLPQYSCTRCAYKAGEWRGVGGDGVGVGKLEGKDVTMGRIFMTS